MLLLPPKKLAKKPRKAPAIAWLVCFLTGHDFMYSRKWLNTGELCINSTCRRCGLKESTKHHV